MDLWLALPWLKNLLILLVVQPRTTDPLNLVNEVAQLTDDIMDYISSDKNNIDATIEKDVKILGDTIP
ncbi:MAG: hypothetical protein IPP29_09760 [Bacteroidetes bacterium]|nr:hypothetical protein [Bacteroidota bacterium]